MLLLRSILPAILIRFYNGPYVDLSSPIMAQKSSTISFCPLGAGLTARYLLLSMGGNQFPGWPSTIMPPASFKMHQAAATSQAQQPHSQNISCCPAAMRQIVIAADPVQRSELTKCPPVALVLANSVKTFRLRSKLTPSRSLPHSIPM